VTHSRTTPPALDDGALDRLLETGLRAVDRGGEAALAHFRRRDLVTGNKADGADFDPVTAGDRACESAIRAVLAAERPDDAILGEEEAPRDGTSGLTWVIDPIDGTRAYLSGLPTWGVLVALDDGASGRIGIVDQPFTGERFVGLMGSGARAWLSHRGAETSIAVRRCADLAAATLFTTAPEMFEGTDRAAFEAVRAKARLTRYGIDCYAYALLAMGHIDLVIEAGLARYDIAAPAALVEAAGGIVTDWAGGDARHGGRVIAAGDARVHAEALALLSGR